MFDPDAGMPRLNRSLIYLGACLIAGIRLARERQVNRVTSQSVLLRDLFLPFTKRRANALPQQPIKTCTNLRYKPTRKRRKSVEHALILTISNPVMAVTKDKENQFERYGQDRESGRVPNLAEVERDYSSPTEVDIEHKVR